MNGQLFPNPFPLAHRSFTYPVLAREYSFKHLSIGLPLTPHCIDWSTVPRNDT